MPVRRPISRPPVAACSGTDDPVADPGPAEATDDSLAGDDQPADDGTCDEYAETVGVALGVSLVARWRQGRGGGRRRGEDLGYVCSLEDSTGTVHVSTSTARFADPEALAAADGCRRSTAPSRARGPRSAPSPTKSRGGDGYTLVEDDTSATAVLLRDTWQYALLLELVVMMLRRPCPTPTPSPKRPSPWPTPSTPSRSTSRPRSRR